MFVFLIIILTYNFYEDAANCPPEPASAILWTYYYLAQHYDHQKNSAKALEYINLAIEHTPTLIELFVTKGRLFKVLFFYLKLSLFILSYNKCLTNSMPEILSRLTGAWTRHNHWTLLIDTSTQSAPNICCELILSRKPK